MITAVQKETQIRAVKWKLFNTDPIDHFHIDHNAPCLTPKILNNHCLGFSWDDCNTPEKLETAIIQILGGGGGWVGGGNKEGALWSM